MKIDYSDCRVYMRHVKEATKNRTGKQAFCVKGMRNFCVVNKINFNALGNEGIPLTDLLIFEHVDTAIKSIIKEAKKEWVHHLV